MFARFLYIVIGLNMAYCTYSLTKINRVSFILKIFSCVASIIILIIY